MTLVQVLQVAVPPLIAFALALFVAPRLDAWVGSPPQRDRITKVLSAISGAVVGLGIGVVLAFALTAIRIHDLETDIRDHGTSLERYIEQRSLTLERRLAQHVGADEHSLPFFRAAITLSQIDDPEAELIFSSGLQWQRDLATSFAAGRMHVARHQIFKTWESLLDAADRDIRATNAVSRDDWQGFSRDGAGLTAQKRARSRGTRISRLMLYTGSLPEHVQGLSALGKAHSDFGIEVKYQDRRWVRRAEKYRDFMQKLGTDDFVIIDNRMLLLTYLDDETHQMLYSELTRDPELIRIANAFWSDLWQEASPAPPVSGPQ